MEENKKDMTNTALEEQETDDEEKYKLSPWGCLYIILYEYGINPDDIKNSSATCITGAVGKHLVEDFMESMCKAGYIEESELPTT